MMMMGADVSTTCSCPRVMMVQELLSSRYSAGRLWQGLVVMMVMVVIHHDLGVGLSARAFILCHIIEVAGFTVATTIVGVSTLNHV